MTANRHPQGASCRLALGLGLRFRCGRGQCQHLARIGGGGIVGHPRRRDRRRLLDRADATARGVGGRREGHPFRHPMFDLGATRSEEHTSELQSLMRTSYAVFCLKKKKKKKTSYS